MPSLLRVRGRQRCDRTTPVRLALSRPGLGDEPPLDPGDDRRVWLSRSGSPTTPPAFTSLSAAVALGVRLLEKHVTLDRSMSGPDHPFAIEPKELAELVADVRDIEAALGDGVKRGPSDEESVEMYTKARRSIVAAVAIPAGTVVRREMLCVKRPGFWDRAQADRRGRWPNRVPRH